MALIDNSHRLSITEATRRGVSGLVAAASKVDIVLERHGEPVAAIVDIQRLSDFDEVAADLRDLALVLTRAATDSGERIEFDEVLNAFGVTRDQLDSLPSGG